MVIWLTPSPSTVHVVYGWPLWFIGNSSNSRDPHQNMYLDFFKERKIFYFWKSKLPLPTIKNLKFPGSNLGWDKISKTIAMIALCGIGFILKISITAYGRITTDFREFFFVHHSNTFDEGWGFIPNNLT